MFDPLCAGDFENFDPHRDGSYMRCSLSSMGSLVRLQVVHDGNQSFWSSIL